MASAKNGVYPEVGLNIVMVHGALSNGDDFDELARRIALDPRLVSAKARVSVVKYGKLLLSVGYIPFVKRLVGMYIASRLATCTYKYPNAKTVVFAHSFGTWAVAYAIKELYKEFRLDMLILAGSVIPRSYAWHRYGLWVNNFVGIKDWVVLMSPLWGTGWSGRFGFKRTRVARKVFSGRDYSVCDNLSEYYRDWKHGDYNKGYDEYIGLILDYLGVEALKK